MIEFKHHSGVHTLRVEQKLSLSLEDAWNFFSSPQNLTKITPSHMGFNITSPLQASMYAGQIITYKIALLPGVPANWVTEITHVEARSYFVDEQRFGPYSMWHHEHRFIAVDGGVLMTDKVTYKVPLGLIGQMIEWLYIRRQLRKIFDFREKVLNEMFPGSGKTNLI